MKSWKFFSLGKMPAAYTHDLEVFSSAVRSKRLNKLENTQK
jgi:hypothetical protein